MDYLIHQQISSISNFVFSRIGCASCCSDSIFSILYFTSSSILFWI